MALPFFGIGMKTDLFQSCVHCWVFHICWHIECSTFTASSFRIWNSSTGITSPPLALFVVMLPKAHLTLHSRMSGSRWVITPLCYDQMLQVKKLTSAFYDGQCVLSNVMQIYVHACVLGGGRKEKRFSWQHIDPNQESTSSLKTVWSLCSGPLRPRSLQLLRVCLVVSHK